MSRTLSDERRSFDLDERSQRKLSDGYCRPGGTVTVENLGVDAVHLTVVRHVREEDGRFGDLGERETLRFKHASEIRHRLPKLRRYTAFDDRPILDTDLA